MRKKEIVERDTKIVLDFLSEPVSARRLARKYHVSESTIRRVLKSSDIDIALYADDIDRSKARALVVDVAKLYGRHSVEGMSSMLSQPTRIIRAAIYFAVQGAIIEGPFGAARRE